MTDPGDAAAASATIDSWLAGLGGPKDFETVLTRMRLALTQLVSHPLVVSDPVAAALLSEAVDAPDLEGVHAAIERLEIRIADLVAGTGVAPASRRQSLEGRVETVAGEPMTRGSRTMLRL